MTFVLPACKKQRQQTAGRIQKPLDHRRQKDERKRNPENCVNDANEFPNLSDGGDVSVSCQWNRKMFSFILTDNQVLIGLF